MLPVTGTEGDVVGYLAVANDVTEQRRSRHLLVAGLEKEAQAVRRLQELDRAKDDFVATVSHELRTPITSILGYIELLLDGDPAGLDEDQMDMLRAVQRNGDRLRALADDLLTLSSFESDEFALHVTDVDLGDVVRRVEEALRPVVSERRLEIRFDTPTQPLTISGDAAHLERVLFNLMSNALKFTEDGGSIVCALRGEPGRAVLEVRDTGIGIPEEDQAQLFTRFFRSAAAQERAIQGTGMGLAIVSSIVARHGGDIGDVQPELALAQPCEFRYRFRQVRQLRVRPHDTPWTEDMTRCPVRCNIYLLNYLSVLRLIGGMSWRATRGGSVGLRRSRSPWPSRRQEVRPRPRGALPSLVKGLADLVLEHGLCRGRQPLGRRHHPRGQGRAAAQGDWDATADLGSVHSLTASIGAARPGRTGSPARG